MALRPSLAARPRMLRGGRGLGGRGRVQALTSLGVCEGSSGLLVVCRHVAVAQMAACHAPWGGLRLPQPRSWGPPRAGHCPLGSGRWQPLRHCHCHPRPGLCLLPITALCRACACSAAAGWDGQHRVLMVGAAGQAWDTTQQQHTQSMMSAQQRHGVANMACGPMAASPPHPLFRWRCWWWCVLGGVPRAGRVGWRVCREGKTPHGVGPYHVQRAVPSG